MKIYITSLTACLVVLWAGCARDGDGRQADEPQGRVELRGIIPNSDGVNGDNIYLRAVVADDPTREYIPETLIGFDSFLSDTEQAVVFPGDSPYYPLNGNDIQIFAYSGKAVNNGSDMKIVAGQGDQFDAVLSNSGWRKSHDLLSPPLQEGPGTPGSSDDPAKLLQFRHVMTQLNVKIEVDTLEVPFPVDPPPSKLIIEMDGVLEQGTYPIDAKAPVENSEDLAQRATASGGKYMIGLGTNYLVPNGTDLDGIQFSRLVIDDYFATDDDLAGFTVTPKSGTEYTKLVPGYAYELVLTVQKLRVTKATISLVGWNREELTDSNATYDPYTLTLELGNYAGTGENAVERVVLHTDDDKIYVGQAREGVDGIKYVILPPATANVTQADLYTSVGLLISAPITDQYLPGTGAALGNATLNLPLSAGGMQTVNQGAPSASNPYMVTNPVQFINIGMEPNGWYRQTGDIDLTDLLTETNIFDGFPTFGGVYDGNGFWIANLNISGNGVFGTNNGILSNIRIYSGTVDASGQTYAGTICGVNNGTIVACINEGRVVNAITAGGICGYNGAGGTIIACINTGNILAGETLGGICGANASVTAGAVAACINTGSLRKQAANIGGICGRQVTDTAAEVFQTSFWLVGTAQHQINGPESVIGTGSAGTGICSDLDPNKLRNEIDINEPGSNRILELLNDRIAAYPAWNGVYQYILDFGKTGITWPTPVKSI